MKKDFYLMRYALIIRRLEKSPATYKQLKNYLLNSFEFQDAGIKEYSIRTLQRDLLEIDKLFGLTVSNRRNGENCYYIESRPEMEIDEYNQKLLETYQMGNALNVSHSHSDAIFFDNRKPGGLNHIYNLFFAIRNLRISKFHYYNYQTRKITPRKVHPLALKESRDRWYLIAVDRKDKKLKSFGLDRISNLSVTEAMYVNEYDYNFREYFKNAFGVMKLEDQSPEKIVIECSRQQGEYIMGFPLHHSQKVVGKIDKNIVFEFFLHPTYDFLQEILSYGKEVKVLEPQSLINEIKVHLMESMKNYF
jgi:predicted DNA-binding transcriptional regulator YafY